MPRRHRKALGLNRGLKADGYRGPRRARKHSGRKRLDAPLTPGSFHPPKRG